MIKTLLYLSIFIVVAGGLNAQTNNYENFGSLVIDSVNSSSFKEFLFGKNLSEIRKKELLLPVISLDSLVLINQRKVNDTLTYYYSNKNKTIYYQFIPLSDNIENITPKLIFNTISENSKDELKTAINPFAPVIASGFLQSYYLNYTKLDFVLFDNNFDRKPGYFRKLNDTSSLSDENYIKSSELVKLIDDYPFEQIDYASMLKYRLLDLYLGNVNTVSNEIYFTKESGKYSPDPNIKLGCLPKFEGLLYFGAKLVVPSLISFSKEFKSIENMTWKNRYLDKRLLIKLSKAEWDSVTKFIYDGLTDSLILNSSRIIPGQKNQSELFLNLQNRRAKFINFSNDYYSYINKHPEIYGSNLCDSIIITRMNNDFTKAEIFYDYRSKNSVKFTKIFDNQITNEIRVYLGLGNDYCKILGSVDASPIIKVIGGEGNNRLIDSSQVKGYFLYVTPFSNDENNTYFFNGNPESEIVEAAGTIVNPKSLNNYITLDEKYDTELRDYGHSWSFYPILELNTDEGIISGGGPVFTKYNFGLLPYDYTMKLTASYATKPKSYKISYDAEFNNILPNSSLLISAVKSDLSFDKFFGYGNETVYNFNDEKSGYYKSIFKMFNLSIGSKRELTKHLFSNVTILYEYSDIKLSSEELLDNFKYGKYGIGVYSLIGFLGGLTYDSRDNVDNPHEGEYLQISGVWYPKIDKLEYPFGKAKFDFRVYKNISDKMPTILAFRIGGEGVFGKYPFLKGAFIGGKESIRGLVKNRFAGDYGLFAQTELRAQLKQLDIFVKSKAGMHLFYDIGRVFIEGDKSSIIHSAVGTGVWLDFFDRLFTVVASIAFSNEKPELLLSTYFGF